MPWTISAASGRRLAIARSDRLPPARRLVLPGLFVAALFAVVIWRQPGTEPSPTEWVLSGPTMGTSYTVKLAPEPGEARPPEGLDERIRAVLDGVNQSMSTYVPDSEISAFNRHGTGPFPASPQLLQVLSEAQRIAELTGGAFDVTVGPLVDAWGFGPSGVTDEPSGHLLDALQASTGFRLLELNPDRSSFSKRVPEVRVDLSAIAKGYAVDRVAELLEASARTGFMVEIGGEVRVRGRNARGSLWRIGIERPDDAGRTLYTSIPLDGLALATSGDYRNFFIRNGVRLSHTIDPRTGRPVDHDLASVSVVHARCMTADALATGLEVLGPAEGPAFADRQGIAALFMVREQNGGAYREIVSKSWHRLFEMEPAGEDVIP